MKQLGLIDPKWEIPGPIGRLVKGRTQGMGIRLHGSLRRHGR